jgi:DNA-binding NtrC family response regulator
MTARARILILDDDAPSAAALAQALTGDGYEVRVASDPAAALDSARAFCADLLLLDLTLPADATQELIAGLSAQGAAAPVIVLSADQSAQSAVRAMKLGAADYLTKPIDLEETKLVVAAILEQRTLKQEVAYLRRISDAELSSKELVGTSPPVQRLREGLEKLAKASVSMVLITGESGTGKELVARQLHRLLHAARPGRLAPFVGLNCAALPETLVENELFGHEKGAFTDAHVEGKGVFELAAGGTILLDEIGEMPWHLQSKLLRVLEERSFRRVGGRHDLPVQATVVATTNRDLDAAIKNGDFRVDLFYRLATFSLQMPPLRERGEDILALSRHFLASFARKYRRAPITDLSPAAARLLLAYPWPGNVRELRNVMERIVVLEAGGVVLPEHLPKEILSLRQESHAEPLVGPLLPEEGLSLDALERSLIEQALGRAHGNKAQAAKLLGITYDSLRYQVKKLGLDGERAASGDWVLP